LLTRLPFLPNGYGVDFDAWLLAESARSIAQTGEYVASRRPGYPVVEVLLAPLMHLGPWATNGASALMSIACVLLLRDLLARAGARAASALALAFAVMPAVWIASVSTMDYLWGLALALGALNLADRGHGLRAGLLLGLAIGARATSGLFGLPMLILLRRAGRPMWPSALLSLTLGLGLYVPVVLRHGFGWLVVSTNGHPGLAFAGRGAALGMLGEVGWVALLVVGAVALARRPKRNHLAKCGGLIALMFVALYTALPYEPAYLLPAAAGLLLYLGPGLGPRVAALLPAALLISSLVGVRLPAPLLHDRATRLAELRLTASVAEAVRQERSPVALLCGQMYPKVRFALGGAEQIGPVALHVVIKNEGRLRALISSGVKLRYVPGIEDWYERQGGYRIERIATPIVP
jgi:hypothetical protein